jgi:hypothetical protein
MDYQANSHRAKGPSADNAEKKEITRVTTNDVTRQKRTITQKLRDSFVAVDAKTVFGYVLSDVMLPAARNLIFDSMTKGVERMMYGETSPRNRPSMMGQPTTRFTYNSVPQTSRRYIESGYKEARGPQTPKQFLDSVVFITREEADLVLERMIDLIDQYREVSVADFNELVGLRSSHTDNKWGWVYLRGASIQQTRDGFVINLPPATPI